MNTRLITATLLAAVLSSCSGFHRFEAYPFGVQIGSSIEDTKRILSDKGDALDWNGSDIPGMREKKRDGVKDSLLDRTPAFGTMVMDEYLDEPLKFVAKVPLSMPIPTNVDTYCAVTAVDSVVTSLVCISSFVDFADVSSAVKSYVQMLDKKYGGYKPLTDIVPDSGTDYSSLHLFKEGAFQWTARKHVVELFVNHYPLLREAGLQDITPMDRYEVVLRYR